MSVWVVLARHFIMRFTYNSLSLIPTVFFKSDLLYLSDQLTASSLMLNLHSYPRKFCNLRKEH